MKNKLFSSAGRSGSAGLSRPASLSRSVAFIKNVLLLTGTGLLLRTVSLSFNLYLKNKLGGEGVGLFSLIMSVFGFAVTFATGGTALMVTRLVSEALGKNRPREVKTVMQKSLLYALFFGATAGFLLFTFAPLLGQKVLGDARTVKSLRTLALSLPALALSSAFSGYFTAVRRVSRSAAVQIGEQLLRVFLTMAALSFLAPAELEAMCFFVVLGGVISDLASFALSAFVFLRDRKKYAPAPALPADGQGAAARQKREEALTKKMLAIGLPVAFSSYFRSALVTVEHLLIPKGLRQFGMTAAEALAGYGLLEAVCLPILMFPYAFLTPFYSLLVPEIAEKKAAGQEEDVRRLSARALGFSLMFGVGVSAVMIATAPLLGQVMGGSAAAGRLLALLAPLIPVMYADTIVDSLLKGVNEQLYTMRVNIADAVLSVILALITVPKFGIYGYVFNIIFCEIVNFALSAARLFTTIAPAFSFCKDLLLPMGAGLSAMLLFLLGQRFWPLTANKPTLAFSLAGVAGLYLLLLFYMRRRIKGTSSGKPFP